MSLFMYPVQQAAETPLVPAQICTKTCLKCTLRWKAVIKSLHCIYSIFIFGLVSKNEYIQYSYSFRYLGTNIFDIRIRSGCKKRIYSIFVFGQLSRYEYIRYSYSVNFFFTNIFVFVFGQEFDIRVTLSGNALSLSFLLLFFDNLSGENKLRDKRWSEVLYWKRKYDPRQSSQPTK